ncbi:MAG: PDZ domain-containing protein [Planctomycetota bacterium]
MTRISRFPMTLAAGMLAVAGLAAPAAAQHSSTTISIDDGEIEGSSIRVIDGTEFMIEFDEDGVHSAYIDDDEVDFKSDENAVYIVHDGEIITMDLPDLGAAGQAFTFGRGVGDAMAFIRPAQQDGNRFVIDNRPRTMVGLTQSSLEDQLREHLDLEEGVGTMILSVVEGLPADEGGLREGDVLIAVDGREVTGADVLTDELRELEPGDEIDVTVLRKGLPETLTIEVAEFDAERLYGERFFRERVPGAIAAPRILRWEELDDDDFPFARDFDMDFDFDFDDLQEQIEDQLHMNLDAEQRQELENALGQARDQIEAAMKQAERARALALRADPGGEILLRGLDNELPLLIEREGLLNRARELGDRHPEVIAQRRQLEERMHELELRREELDERRAEIEERTEELRVRNQELTEQNKELRKRLNSLESKLDRLLAHLEDSEERDEK